MAKQQKEDLAAAIINSLQGQDKVEEKELVLGSEEPEVPLPLTVTSRVLYMLGDITSGPAYRLTQWLELVRKRSGRYGSSGFQQSHGLNNMPSSAEESSADSKSHLLPEQAPEISLRERLGKVSMLDIESSSFSWDMLSSLHHAEHSSSTDHSEDEQNKALEVTVNSGGVVFFALFNQPGLGDVSPNQAAAVIKFSSSRMATQSERLGYEFARWLGVRTPQARVIHTSSPEWLQIKEAAEKTRVRATSEGDEVGEVICSELLEALELSRCLLLMSYVHGSPLLESSSAFESQETAEKTAAALGRVLLLDLVIRNEDRLPCRQLRWRGNPANLLLADKMSSANTDTLEEAFDSAIYRYRPRVIRALQKERRSTSVDSRFSSHGPLLVSQSSNLSEISESPSENSLRSGASGESTLSDSHIVAIDSGVPRRPPAGKRANDHAVYPKLVELLLNCSDYSANLLHDITGGKLGIPPLEDGDNTTDVHSTEMALAVQGFRSGFRAALRDLQGFHIFLLTLHQKLDNLLRQFLSIINKTLSADFDKEDCVNSESPSPPVVPGDVCSQSPPTASKEQVLSDHQPDYSDSESQRTAPRLSSSGHKEITDYSSQMLREVWPGKSHRGNGDQLRSLRLTAKLRDFHKFAKVDAESSKELEQWNEMLKNDVVKLCQENNFISGFFEGSDSHSVVDAYELKVRLEHILERIGLISEAANTEKPSSITDRLFIGGALAARSIYTLEHLGVTHILCLCSNEIGQSDSQYPDHFVYKNFSNAGLSSSSLKLHLQKAHKWLSSGSVDSAMTMEIQKAVEALKISRS
ncbi:hypothetical protein SLEP1_g27927 [Rubroshorea leprosula]|uniref:Actin-fragmin kinase catalytic domain-containing protein n=1 Tax=Rubroshorea leprosula TaxID=152421 RepID=A0AAV5JUM2_9ROSI|nr:hypothetical protein SLEP1_g27927 [Rubroshorea leprosula]